ncbi:cytochrome P450 [Chiua virens]|nr:cytochrome P450 [Chiua virens]
MQVSTLQQNTNLIFAATACGIVATMTMIARSRLRWYPSLDAFPTVGFHSWFDSWWVSDTYLSGTAQMLQQGYNKYRSKPFKIAYQHRWMVILNKREHLEQVLKASQDELSFRDALSERLNLRYTVGYDSLENADHAVRALSQLTRHTRTMYPDMRDEIVTTFDELLDLEDGNSEWKSIPALSMVQQVICRVSNRVFVGLPLCRNPDYIDLGLSFAIDVLKAGLVIGKFPKFMRPLAAIFFARVVTNDKARALKHLGPIIEKRLQHLEEYGYSGNAWTETPDDLLSWLIDEGEGSGFTVESLVLRVLIVNLSATSDSSHVRRSGCGCHGLDLTSD